MPFYTLETTLDPLQTLIFLYNQKYFSDYPLPHRMTRGPTQSSPSSYLPPLPTYQYVSSYASANQGLDGVAYSSSSQSCVRIFPQLWRVDWPCTRKLLDSHRRAPPTRSLPTTLLPPPPVSSPTCSPWPYHAAVLAGSELVAHICITWPLPQGGL